MAKDNINPNHYKFGNFETIDLIQEVVEDFGSVCQANILKYGIRANRKHDNPKVDVNKIIRYCEFWMNDIEGVKASEKRSEETNHQEDFSPFDKLHSLLNDQEMNLIKDKNIKVIHLNGLKMLEDFIKEKEDRRNGKHEANR